MNKHAMKTNNNFLKPGGWSRFAIICTVLILLNLLIFYFLPGNIYLYLAYTLIVIFIFKVSGFSSKHIFIFSFIYLMLASIIKLTGNCILAHRWLDGLSFYVLSLPVTATLTYIYEEKLEGKISYKKRNRAYFYLSLFSIFIFMFSLVFVNRVYFEVCFFNKFYTEKYFNGEEILRVNGEDVYNKMCIQIETPHNYEVIDGIFTVEGWAIDESKIPGTKIDYVGVWMDNKPAEGGKFICRCDYGIDREDVSKSKGDEYKKSGFYCEIDSNKFEDSLRKFYVYYHSNNFGWKYDVLELFINNKESFIFEGILGPDGANKEIEQEHSSIVEDKRKIILEEGEGVLKYVKIPINIKSGQDYLVSFDIKRTSTHLDNDIFFDFFGDGYDNPAQEFKIEHTFIDRDYKKINRLINSGDVPDGTDVYFRVFTYSGGSVKIENLAIYRVIGP
ncbi:MAG: hypothetical protein PHG41_07025 [Actinomycetota bacterium]|nr:hypothetical protein [Actinomycetota bacterium]